MVNYDLFVGDGIALNHPNRNPGKKFILIIGKGSAFEEQGLGGVRSRGSHFVFEGFEEL